MDVYEAAISRRSIRQFKDIAVPYDVLEKCANTARLAPSAKNRQLCEYIIVDDEQLLPDVFDSITTWGGQARPQGGSLPRHRPKAYIITLINSALETEVGGNRRSTTYDVGMAAENITLSTINPLFSFDI